MKTLAGKTGLLILLGTMGGCFQADQVKDILPPEAFQTERAYPDIQGTHQKGYLNGYPATYQLVKGESVFESDIILNPEELSSEPTEVTTTGRSRTSARWPNKIIYYQISPTLPDPARVYQAMAHWEANTSIRFVAQTTQRAYVLFRAGSGCSANIGYNGGVQYVNLGSSCTTGNTIHEIGHIVGLWHEHSRADRANHITVHYENVSPGAEINFDTYLGQGFDGFDYGNTIDLMSVMMYSPYDFSKNGLPTITKKDGSLYTVQRTGLSALDRATVAYMYP